MSKASCTSQATAVCVDVSGGTQPDCVSSPTFAVTPLTSGVTAKIPVTLAELTVQVNMDSIITLPEPALEIKDIKKRVKVTQCLLLQPTNVLFLKGFVRKNIDYATRRCSNSEGVCGDIRHCTVDVPFRCSTTVSFNGIQPEDPVPNNANEFEFFRRQKLRGPGFAEKDQLLSGDLSEFNQVSEEFFNELPFCELIHARIVEFDEFLNRGRPNGVSLPFEEREFRKIEEKMVLYITLKILQNQQVVIPSPTPIKPCGQETQSGGEGTTVTTHYLGPTSGTVKLRYEMYFIKDELIVRRDGNIVAQTGGPVSGSGCLQFYYDASAGSQYVEVTVIGPSGTAWNYTIGCPGEDPCNSLNSFTTMDDVEDIDKYNEWLAANGGNFDGEGK